MYSALYSDIYSAMYSAMYSAVCIVLCIVLCICTVLCIVNFSLTFHCCVVFYRSPMLFYDEDSKMLFVAMKVNTLLSPTVYSTLCVG